MFWNSTKKKFRDVGRSPEAAEYLAMQLERLMALPLSTPEEIECFYNEAAIVDERRRQLFPGFEPEHEVGHFFDDADIRAKDSGYRLRQHRIMSEYVQFLRTNTDFA